MSTVHIGAEKGDFAKTVLMPGDPLRAKYIAENFLTDVKQVNGVRGMLGYTGYYEGKKISVMGSGMGMPSIGIYSYELFTEFDVDNIIRIGSAGGYSEKLHVRDVVLAQAACTNSNYAVQYGLQGTFAPIADYGLLKQAEAYAKELGINVVVGNTLSSDMFYNADPDAWKKWAEMGVLAVEMEAAALYMNAAKTGKKALAILTISDHFIYTDITTAEERETTLNDMIKIALKFGE
ncbi:MAG: purine-nucleoside phosphorylase [Anaerofustis stercorihominis]|nr:purine-nucleoside phosphorylase [Anaerofustis stercorihominis]